MENIKKKVIDWFNGNQDYYEGLELLQVVSKKNKVIGKMIKRGNTSTNREKLIWELNKVAGLKTIPKPSARKPEPGKSEKQTDETAGGEGKKTKLHLIEGDLGTYPLIIRRLVNEYSELYKQRGQNHKALKELPEGNDPETVKKRIPHMEVINEASARMEVLFSAFEEYKKDGKIPEESKLWPGSDNKKEEDPVKLRKRKKNIIASLTKDRNTLLYGSKTKPKDGKENPLPDGPRKIKVEKRIKQKEDEILKIDKILAETE